MGASDNSQAVSGSKNGQGRYERLAGRVLSEFLASRKSEECGCLEEDWIMGMVDVTLHIEPDGNGEAFLYNGDTELEVTFECSGIGDLREKVADYIQKNPFCED